MINNIAINNVLIFDLDGTLINTDKTNFLSYKEAVLKVKKIDLKLLYKNKERFTRRQLYSIIPNLKNQEYKDIIEIKNGVYCKYLHKSKMNNFVFSFIEKFSQTNTIILATNAHKDRVDMLLKYHNLIKNFNHKFYKEDYKSQQNNKFEYIVNYLNIKPHLAVVFEDDKIQIQKAVLSGIPTKNIINMQKKI